MKKLFAVIALTLVSACAYTAKAQFSALENLPPYKLGVTVGYNGTTFSGSSKVDGSHSKDYDFTSGLQLGANLMVDASTLLPNTFGRIEVKYSMKGADWESGVLNEHVTLHYLDIPIHYGYAWYINKDVTVMAETGPYFAFGLYGSDRINGSTFSVFGGQIGGKRFDFGWGIQASAMIARDYQVHLGFDYGFLNVTNNYLQNRMINVGLTWFFESLFE